MLERRFRELEINFYHLDKKFRRGEISRDEYVRELKKLRLVDEEGRCWMIGVQTRRWYYYDGQRWIQAEPPEDDRPGILCLNCCHENDPGSSHCESCGELLKKTPTRIFCVSCGQLVDPAEKVCPFCGVGLLIRHEERKIGDTGPTGARQEKNSNPEKPVFYLRSVDRMSFLLFSGGLGIFLGLISGLILGATEFFPELVAHLPAFLKEMQGKLIGGLVFSLLGGAVGFLLAAISGFFLAVLVNAAIYFFGPPAFRMEKSRRITTGK